MPRGGWVTCGHGQHVLRVDVSARVHARARVCVRVCGVLRIWGPESMYRSIRLRVRTRHRGPAGPLRRTRAWARGPPSPSPCSSAAQSPNGVESSRRRVMADPLPILVTAARSECAACRELRAVACLTQQKPQSLVDGQRLLRQLISNTSVACPCTGRFADLLLRRPSLDPSFVSETKIQALIDYQLCIGMLLSWHCESLPALSRYVVDLAMRISAHNTEQ